MNYSKTILCAAVIAVATLFSSCQKDDANKDGNKYSADLSLSFTTTDDINNLTIRQFEVLLNGKTLGSTNIVGTSFSKTLSLPNLDVPATIDVKVSASSNATEVPETFSAMSAYNITCTVGKKSAVDGYNGPKYSNLPRSEFAEFVDVELNTTAQFKISEDGNVVRVD